MKALVRVMKWLIITAAALAVLPVAGYFGYVLYLDYQANKALTLRTSQSDWQWQKERELGYRRSSDVQWEITEEIGYHMRRVYDDRDVYARLVRDDDGALKLKAFVSWPIDCEDGTSIETSVTDSVGNSFDLMCLKLDWGNRLSIGVEWNDVDLDDLPRWSNNFDGFKVSEDFDDYAWDFQPALRHLTLQSAKPPKAPWLHEGG